MDGLYELLNRDITVTDSGRDGFFDIHGSYLAPGFWTGYVSRARSRNLSLQDLKVIKGTD